MDTSCKNCLFAEYEEKTQVGCEMGRLDKWRGQTEVIPAYDEEREFFVLKDRRCNAFHEFGEYTPETIKEKIRLPYDLLIVVNSKQDIDSSLQFDVKVPPKNIFIINYGPELDKVPYLNKGYTFIQLLVPYIIEDAEYHGAQQVKSYYYVPLLSGQQLSADFIDRAEQIYNEELRQFSLFERENVLALKKAVIMANGRERMKEQVKEIDPSFVIEE